jgi:hypothetical protein
MKPNTAIWASFTNVGKPNDSLTIQGSVRDITTELVKWLLKIYMGQKIRVCLARSEEELSESRQSQTVKDMMSELDALIAADSDDSPEHTSAEQSQ